MNHVAEIQFIRQFIFIFLAAKLLILLPFDISVRTGKVKCTKYGVYASLLVGATYYTFHLYSAYYQMITQHDSNFVTRLIDSYNQYAGCSILMTIYIVMCINQRQLVEAIQAIQSVDQFLLDEKREKSSAQRYLLQYNIPLYAFLTGICVMEYYFCIMFIKDTPTFSTYCLLMCYVPLLVHATTEFVLCILLCCVTERLRLLRSRPLQLKGIRPLKLVFDSLKEATYLINSSFKLPVLLLIFHQFTAITTLTYDLAVAIVKFDYQLKGYTTTEKIILQLESSGGWTMFFVTETLILCYVCDHLRTEMRECGLFLQSIHLDNAKGQRHRWIQLQLAARMKDNFAISACGLFNIDLSLFYNMIGAITTYLIILVQFDVAQRETVAVIEDVTT